MEETKYDYDPAEEHEEDYYDEPQPEQNRSIRGYRIVIGLLSVILVAISILYYNIHSQQMRDNELMAADRDSLQQDLTELIVEYDDLKYQNDSIAVNLERANALVEQLKQERRWNYNKLKQYEKELGTLRTVMMGYIKQIDSLNTLNKKLITENVGYRKEISSANLRADLAEERSEELENKVKAGAVVRARNIRLVALNAKSKEVSRIKKAERMRVDFELAANELATPGNKAIYVRITSPEGYLMQTEAAPSFEFEGEKIGYSAAREVEYQNEDLAVSIFFEQTNFMAGTYQVELYMEGRMIGTAEQAMR
ncbi:MAG: hypothetical protein IJN55_02345 [Alistipes sp.]|nr:hypothetical protein [Rikenellaceae bacterium]MBQ6881388.1 hypothetical protein [Alistipes sp.]MBR3847001.1 hypothetical protein [Alistipes sp.]